MNGDPVVIVSPATASDNNGNWHTAARWQGFLSAHMPTTVVQRWCGEAAGAMVALHARRSAESVAAFRRAHPQRPLALVLTGTDLYGDLDADAAARHSLQCASHVVVLQHEALGRLPPPLRAKARVIVQSAPRMGCVDPSADRSVFVAVGHLRSEKDPLTLMRAARLLSGTAVRITHIGQALDAALGDAARALMQDCPHYRWLGGLSQTEARRHIACAGALVHMSRVEGGANVVVEAVRSQVPVLASRIDGNVGLLGRDYGGYFPAGDAAALAQLMHRVLDEPAFAARLRAQCARVEPQFDSATEAAAVLALLSDMQRGPAGPVQAGPAGSAGSL